MMEDTNDKEQQQCGPFTLLQTRRIAAKKQNSNMIRLCPSMDLLLVVSSSTTSSASLTIYRSVTFQKLVTMNVISATSTAAAVTTNSSLDATSHVETASFTHVSWRPDGRWIACGDNQGNIVLYELEDILTAATASSSSTTTSSSSSSSSSSMVVVTPMTRPKDPSDTPSIPQQQFMSLAFSANDFTQLRALVWHHVGKSHPSWTKSTQGSFWDNQIEQLEQEEEQYFSKLLCSHSRESLYLPYRNQKKRNQNYSYDLETNIDTTTTTLPTDQTPLSLLIAISQHTTTENDANAWKLHLSLHGCYPILKNIYIPVPVQKEQRHYLSASDQEKDAIVVTATNLTQVAVCIPSHPNLVTLFSISSFRQHRYALQTISALYASTTTRMYRLQTALPDISGSWRSCLKPLDMKLQALVRLLENYGLFEHASFRQLLVQYILSGHTRAAPNLSNAMDQFFTSVQMNDQLIQRLEQSLVVAVANVESQCREHLLEPAQACVYQFSTLNGLARQVEADPLNDDIEDSNGTHISMLSSEHSLRCLQRAELLLLTVERALVLLLEARIRLRDWMAWLRAVGAQIKARGTAPQSARHENARKRRVPDAVVKRLLGYLSESTNESNDSALTETILHLEFAQYLVPNDDQKDNLQPSIFTLPQCFHALHTAATALFDVPPLCVSQQLQTTQLIWDDIIVPKSLKAMIIRMGRGGAPHDGEGFYCPSSNAASFRQWLLVALPSTDPTCLDLHAIPIMWDGKMGLASPHTWTARLQFDRCDEILATEFYSDDGKSTLSGDSHGKEGSRQALAVLIRVQGNVVLTLIPYDDLELSMQAMQPRESSLLVPRPINTIQIQSNDSDEGTVSAKSRLVSYNNSNPASLVLSGSRGMAAVECFQESQGVVLHLFDLEEDEDDNDEEEEEEENEEAVDEGSDD